MPDFVFMNWKAKQRISYNEKSIIHSFSSYQYIIQHHKTRRIFLLLSLKDFYEKCNPCKLLHLCTLKDVTIEIIIVFLYGWKLLITKVKDKTLQYSINCCQNSYIKEFRRNFCCILFYQAWLNFRHILTISHLLFTVVWAHVIALITK